MGRVPVILMVMGLWGFAWDFGDGGESDEAEPEHEFAAAGVYEVTLTVTDGRGGQGSVTRSVTVAEPVIRRLLSGIGRRIRGM